MFCSKHLLFIGAFFAVRSLSAATVDQLDPAIAARLAASTQQVVAVLAKAGVAAEVQLFEKVSGHWQKKAVYPAVVGKNGFAPPGAKREGDGKTPSGVFDFGTAWGYAAEAPTRMPFRQATSEDKFVDDVKSKDYNKWVHGSTQATSFEFMRRQDGLYEFGLVINYNTNPTVPGDGSAIFLHIWRGQDHGTDGCVALERKNVLEILTWLNPVEKPQIVLNPKALE